MSTNKAHPHAELMKLYAADAAEIDVPWERWQQFNQDLDEWEDCIKDLAFISSEYYRRKPAEPALLQGHTLEQWDFIREQGFDCEFSHYATFSPSFIGRLTKVEGKRFHSDHCSASVGYCRPRRARGVKQPWFGGKCPVDPEARVLVFYRDESFAAIHAMYGIWEHRGSERDTVAFIEL